MCIIRKKSHLIHCYLFPVGFKLLFLKTSEYKGVLISIEPFPEKLSWEGINCRVYWPICLYSMMQKSTTYDLYLSFMFRSKVKMTALPEKFNVEEHRAIIKFLFLQRKSEKQIHDEMSQTMGDSGPSYAAVKHWVVDFKTGYFKILLCFIDKVEAKHQGKTLRNSPKVSFFCMTMPHHTLQVKQCQN